MKQNFSIYIFLCILFLGSAACQDDLLYNGGEIGEGESLVSATVNFKPLTPALNGHTRTAGDIIKSINSLCVLLYNKEGELLKTYPLKEAAPGTTPGEGEYTLTNENRSEDKKTESIGGEDKKLPSAESQTPHADFKLTIPYGRYYIYAVANMDNLLTNESYSKAIQTIKGLKSISLTWDADNIAANNQMFGYFTVTGSEQQDELAVINQPKASLHAWIRRAASKVTIAYDGSNLHENVYIYLKSVTIKDIPTECYLGKESTINKDANDNIEDYGNLIENGESITYAEGTNYNEHWPARITKGKPFYYYTNKEGVSVWKSDYDDDKAKYAKLAHGEENEALFFYENMQGTGKDKRQDATGPNGKPDGELDAPGMNKNPGDEFYKDQKPYGTYIEVKAYYVSNIEDRVGSGEITYRFMLGKNITTDYNAERNHHYKLTLKFNKYANDVDWHIEYEEQKPGIEVPNPYYISYLYNKTMNLPVKINTGGGELVSLKAEILTNNWAPNEAYTGDVKTQLDYPYWCDYDVTSKEGFNYNGHVNTYGNQPWNGFLSLRKTDAIILTATPNLQDEKNGIIYVGTEDKNEGNKKYYNDTKRGNRVYLEDKKEIDNNEDNGKFQIGTPQGEGNEQNITVSIPLYTRAKQMIMNTGYTGNNPFVAYRRRATVKITAEIKFTGRNETESLEETVEIFQVRRIVNPKGIYRKWNNITPFHVTLMRLPRENATEFESFTSEGPWNAKIREGGSGMIELSRYEGETGTPIDFTVQFTSPCPDANTSRFAIIEINYHNYTCQHLIFVRQGDAPIQLVDDGAIWQTYNLVTKDTETESPLDEGSLFKYGNLDDPIAAINQKNYKIPWIKVEENDFFKQPTNPFLELAAKDKEGKPISKYWDDITSETPGENQWETFENGQHIATFDDYNALFDNEDIEQGYGVLYGDDATETAKTIEKAYGYRATNQGTGYGMRGCFVYNNKNSKNLFFPIGASGYGHRKRASNASWGVEPDSKSGILRYSGRPERLNDNLSLTMPLFYDKYMRPGAIYWVSDYQRKEFNGSIGPVIGWDINYFTFDFNLIQENNLYDDAQYGTDACFIRLCRKPN